MVWTSNKLKNTSLVMILDFKERLVLSKAPKQNVRCLECEWELKGTHKWLDGIKCPECNGIVLTEVVKK